jgi:hypothetical protein
MAKKAKPHDSTPIEPVGRTATQEQHIKHIEQEIRRLADRHMVHTVFGDFVALSALSVSNHFDWGPQWQAREDEYLQTIKKYKPEELDAIAKLHVELMIALNQGYTDILGKVFERLELFNTYRGQFFTPYVLSSFMAQMAMGDALQEQVRERGFLHCCEPCCGSGGMAIAMAEHATRQGLDPATDFVITAIDIDQRCVYMTYLQLSDLGIAAQVFHGNTLANEMDSVWYTPAFIMNLWAPRLRERAEQERAAAPLLIEGPPEQAPVQPVLFEISPQPPTKRVAAPPTPRSQVVESMQFTLFKS